MQYNKDWWEDLTKEEQEKYEKDHPGTKKKLTNHQKNLKEELNNYFKLSNEEKANLTKITRPKEIIPANLESRAKEFAETTVNKIAYTDKRNVVHYLTDIIDRDTKDRNAINNLGKELSNVVSKGFEGAGIEEPILDNRGRKKKIKKPEKIEVEEYQIQEKPLPKSVSLPTPKSPVVKKLVGKRKEKPKPSRSARRILLKICLLTVAATAGTALFGLGAPVLALTAYKKFCDHFEIKPVDYIWNSLLARKREDPYYDPDEEDIVDLFQRYNRGNNISDIDITNEVRKRKYT